jgi:adenosine/AMP kinase
MENCRYVDADWNTITSAQMVEVSACMQYIIGVLDGYSFGVLASGKERTMVCNMPDTVTTKQLGIIVAHYLRDNPADLHLPASLAVMKAVDKAFPCKTESH